MAPPAHGREGGGGRGQGSKVEVMERWQGGKQSLNADEKCNFQDVGRKIKMGEDSEGMKERRRRHRCEL